MRRFIYIILLLSLVSCNNNTGVWKPRWDKYHEDMQKVIDLMKANKLKVAVGRSGYQIPDSIDLRDAFGQLAFRQTDFTDDSTYSVVFYLDIHKELRFNPIIVYTDNPKRMDIYKSNGTTKIAEHWYFTYE